MTKRSFRMFRRTLSIRLLSVAVLSLPVGCGFGGGGVTPVRTAYNKGVYQYSQGNLDAAIAEYRLALEEDETDFRARFNLAATLEAKAERLGEDGERPQAEQFREEALKEYHVLLKAHPESARVVVNLASCEFEQGHREAAMNRLQEAVERFPGSALPPLALATHRFRMMQESAATERDAEVIMEGINQALGRNPASVEGQMFLGDVHVFLAKQVEGDEASVLGETRDQHLELAREAYAEAFAVKPSDIATLMALGRLEAFAERWDEAAAWFEQVLYIDADHWAARLLLSETRQRMGEFEAATVHLWRARSLDSGLHPRLSEDEYRNRLLDLYMELATREGGKTK